MKKKFFFLIPTEERGRDLVEGVGEVLRES